MPRTVALRGIRGERECLVPGFEPKGEPARVKILRCAIADGLMDDGLTDDGLGAPGELLDHRLAVACGDGAIRILELQRAGKAPMKAEEFLRGTPLKPGARFG